MLIKKLQGTDYPTLCSACIVKRGAAYDFNAKPMYIYVECTMIRALKDNKHICFSFWLLFERTLRLISIHGNKNSYQYLATSCEIIIKLNKVTTIKCHGQVSRIHMIKGLDPWILRLLL